MSTATATLMVAPDAEALKTDIAAHVLASAKAALAARGRYTLALSGGSMPQTLGGLAAFAADLDWSRVYVLFSDERRVPLEHDDSNYKACHASLLAHLPIPAANILALDPSLDAVAAAAAYQAKLLALLPSPGGVPQIDTVLLGMGPDGHTASLFPGHALLGETEKLVAGIVDSPKPPPERITLTFPLLNAAREVVFIAAGAAKAPLFLEALRAPGTATVGKEEQDGSGTGAGGVGVGVREGLPYPAFQVRPTSGGLWYYTDAAGASMLGEEVVAGKKGTAPTATTSGL